MYRIAIGLGIFVLLCVLIYIAVFGRALRQPENHTAIARALPQALLTSEAIRVDEETILARNTEAFREAMIREGFTYEEQMGAGHILRKGDQRYMSSSRMYSSQMMLFSYPHAVYECNSDARLCPDGSSVGRTGPSCEFPACPPLDSTEARVETYLGGRDGGLGLTINPREVVSDDRCPSDVRCIAAGTVRIRAAVETAVAHGEHVFDLHVPKVIGDITVTLIEVRPNTAELAQNPETGYWFVFSLRRNEAI